MSPSAKIHQKNFPVDKPLPRIRKVNRWLDHVSVQRREGGPETFAGRTNLKLVDSVLRKQQPLWRVMRMPLFCTITSRIDRA